MANDFEVVVYDSAGTPLTGATVTVAGIGTKVTDGSSFFPKGCAMFSIGPTGYYDVTAAMNGYVSQTHTAYVATGSSFTTFNLVPIATVQFTLTINPSSNGSTNPASGTYSIPTGTTYSVTATPNTGYVFDHWELDGANAGTANPIGVVMDANHTLTSVFKSSGGGGGGGGTNYLLYGVVAVGIIGISYIIWRTVRG